MAVTYQYNAAKGPTVAPKVDAAYIEALKAALNETSEVFREATSGLDVLPEATRHMPIF